MEKTAKKKFPFGIGVRVRLVKSIRGSESVKFVGKIGTVSKIAPHQPHLADVKFDEHIGGTDTIVCSGDMLESAALHESVAQSQAEMIHEEMRRVPKRVCPLCRGKGCDYCARTGSYTDENDAQAQPEPEWGTAELLRAAERELLQAVNWIPDLQLRGKTNAVIEEIRTHFTKLALSPLPVREQTFDEWWNQIRPLPESISDGEMCKLAWDAGQAAIAGEKEE